MAKKKVKVKDLVEKETPKKVRGSEVGAYAASDAKPGRAESLRRAGQSAGSHVGAYAPANAKGVEKLVTPEAQRSVQELGSHVGAYATEHAKPGKATELRKLAKSAGSHVGALASADADAELDD